MGSRKEKAEEMAMNQIRVKRIEGEDGGKQRKPNENSKTAKGNTEKETRNEMR